MLWELVIRIITKKIYFFIFINDKCYNIEKLIVFEWCIIIIQYNKGKVSFMIVLQRRSSGALMILDEIADATFKFIGYNHEGVIVRVEVIILMKIFMIMLLYIIFLGIWQ